MKLKKVKKAMEGDMPINSMFNLIPEKRMAEF